MRVLKIIFVLLGISLISSISIGGALWLKWNYIDLPTVKELKKYTPPLVTEVYDVKGRLIGELYEERRFYVPIEKIPRKVQLAFLAAEDARFYEHKGLDYKAIIRAIIIDIKERRFAQGASTITMQVARNMFLSQEKTLSRKIKEMLLAKKLEETLPKQKILELYLNIIYLGHGAYGVEAASRTYFGKSVSNLTLAEGALLASLPKAPTYFSPYYYPQRALERRNWVLSRMLEEGFITKEEYERAIREPLSIRKEGITRVNNAPYFMDTLYQELVAKYGKDNVLKGGLKIYTTIDLDAQRLAENALLNGIIRVEKSLGNIPKDQPVRYELCRVVEVKDNTLKCSYFGNIYTMNVQEVGANAKNGDTIRVWVDRTKRLRAWKAPNLNGALISIDLDTMGIIAFVGGYDYSISQFNRVTQAKRQPGSAFKPIVYVTALENGFSPFDIVVDEPVEFPTMSKNQTWKPKNYDNQYLGKMPLWMALALSRNTVTVKIASQIGIGKIIEMAKRLGIESTIRPDLSSALGASELRVIELVKAYIPFAKGGLLCKPYYITKIVDTRGNVIFENSGPECVQVIDRNIASEMLFMLRKVVELGTARTALSIGDFSAGKTGTSSEYRDAWYIGFTRRVLTGVYIGRDNFQPIGNRYTGSVAALPIWIDYTKGIMPLYPPPFIIKEEEETAPETNGTVPTLPEENKTETPNIPQVPQGAD
ncbi:MAG: penicillin-binding protein 1A [Thermosulfidibacteraceae bacterium]|jgi:penicillin-binding protein 1A